MVQVHFKNDQKIPAYSNLELFYDGISASFHDCYYRASFVDNIKYIALMDIDEIFIPLENGGKSLHELLHKMDNFNVNSFSFINVFMHRNFTDSFGADTGLLVYEVFGQKDLQYTSQ
jgi:hypothetical protein